MRQNQQKGEVQTNRINSFFAPIPELVKVLIKNKSGQLVDLNQLSALVTSSRFKLETSTAVM